MAERCKGKTKNAKPCGGYAQGDSIYCFTHDPKLSSARRRARQLGGYISRQSKDQTSLSGYNVRTLKGLLDFMSTLIEETSRMPQSLKRDQTLNQIAKNLSGLIVQYNQELAEKELKRNLQDIDDRFALQEMHQRVSEIKIQMNDAPSSPLKPA